ncbi:hypothetical protein SSX86_019433 [Deinandra increscens subsp. villosa]|uniref:RRM domain-containing protein n=1 Tax=Deinandra increscens subsp. villosa TaxID=3103831 RepID=A0AAP0GVR0_9ASTR
MDFDEYEYLEKTVAVASNGTDSPPKPKDGGAEKNEKAYRRRDRDKDDGEDDRIIEEDRKSKKTRGEEDNGRSRRDRDRDREDRPSSRSEHHRSSGRDGDRDVDRERERDRRRSSRDGDRERDRGRSSKDREKERDKEKREREREKERERSRRSRSHSRIERERSEKELLREQERELESRESRKLKDKKEVVEPEADPERDQRTVFAYQMPLKATEWDVYEFFSKAGKVRDVRLIMDRNSRRSKGVGYIEFYDAMSVPMAIAMSGQLLLGQPVMVKPSEAEKNLVQSNASTGGQGGVSGPYGAVDRKLYVGNLHFNMTELQLKQIFEPFGPVELVQLPTDLETGQCKGFGFIQFSQLEHAKAAINLNGKLEIAGRTIKVSSVTDHVGVQDSGAKASDFDDDEGGYLSLNAQSRVQLMAKLDRSGIASGIPGSLGVGAPLINGSGSFLAGGLPSNGLPAIPVPGLAQMAPVIALEPVGNPSECLLLKNMFDPATETEPDFDLDIKDDVGEECSKYGRVMHIYVDKHSAGYVYLRFESVDAASRAQQGMHKRWFAGKMISAIFLQPYEYEAKFKGTT